MADMQLKKGGKLTAKVHKQGLAQVFSALLRL